MIAPLPDRDGLELLTAGLDNPSRPNPILFIHGAYTAAWCWQDNYLPWFAERGYACYALSLVAHGNSRGREYLDSYGIDDYVENVAHITRQFDQPPILIGHSMGGMVVQKYLEQDVHPVTAASVLLCSVPPQGLLGSALGLAWSSPNVLVDLNQAMMGAAPSTESIRDALFYRPLDERRLEYIAACAQPESHRALWDMTFFNLPNPVLMQQRPPMLILGAEFDRLIPPSLVYMTAASYQLPAHILPNFGHGCMMEEGWEEGAQRIFDWLQEQTFDREDAPPRTPFGY